jgi:uncharacterized protein (TIRG00374 family)
MLVLFIAGIALAGFTAAGENIWHEVRRLTLAQLGILLLLSLVNYGLRAWRWYVHARALHIPLSLPQVFWHYFGGFALTLTPGRLGELVRLRWITKETNVSAEQAFPLVILDRAADLAAIGLLMAGSFFIMGGVSGGTPIAILCLVTAVLITRPALAEYIVTLMWRILGRWPRRFVRARQSARSLTPFSSVRVYGPSLILGFIGWLAEGYAFYLLLDWMNAPLPLTTCIAIFLFSAVTGGITGAPGGIGGAEVAMVALLTLKGVPIEIGIPATAIIRVTTLWFAIGLGVLTFPIAEARSRRANNALENE